MIANLLTLLASLLIAFAAAEIAVRIALPEWAPGTPRLTSFWQYDPDYGWAHVPGSQGSFESFGFDVDVRINSSGFRGPEFPSRQPGRPRVVVLGDSFVWGYGVQEGQVFTSRLAEACRMDVINMGVSGYSTDQELLLLRKRALALAPDVVVLVVADNDFAANRQATQYVYYHKPVFAVVNGVLVLSNHPAPEAGILIRGVAATARQSYLLTQASRVVQGMMESQTTTAVEPATETPAGAPSSDRRAEARQARLPNDIADELMLALLTQASTETQAAGARLLIAFQAERGEKLRERLEQLAPVMLLNDVLDSAADPRFHIAHDIHWNASGHSIVARALQQKLVAAGLIDAAICH